MEPAPVRDDLLAEQAALDAVVSSIDDEAWALPTPSPGWTIADQIGHLTYFDTTASLAIEDPAAFVAHRDAMRANLGDPAAADAATLGGFRTLAPSDQLAAWRAGRQRLADAASGLRDGDRVEWYGPSMGAASFLTARLMETWAHGQDIVDTLTIAPDGSRTWLPTDRIRHIAQLGVITRNWSYVVHERTPPTSEIRVELDAPSGERWVWGPDDAAQIITGPAVEFCQVVTQRRNVADTALVVIGGDAAEWMGIAQAFAGRPSSGPDPS